VGSSLPSSSQWLQTAIRRPVLFARLVTYSVSIGVFGMRLPLWLRELAATHRARKSNELWRQRRAARTTALRLVELEERRVLAVTSLAAAADISNVNEGQPLSNLTVANFADNDPLNTQVASIDWGDGNTTPGTVQALGGDQYAVVGSHTYTDNAAYQVQVSIAGQSPGEMVFTDQLTITTNNVAPTLAVPADNLYSLDEGSQVTVGNLGVFTDPGTSDAHGVKVDWGDGTVETEFPAQNLFVPNLQIGEANGSGKASGIHVYGDNGVLDANNNLIHTIEVTVFDDDGGSTTRQFNVIVNNVAPTLTVQGDKTIAIDEGQQVAFSNLGLFTDPGYLDTHTATVDWGDGTGVQAATVAEANGSGKITGAHVYGDNGLLDANGDYVRTIKVTVTDDDGASTSKEFTIIVNNVAPTLTVPGDNTIAIDEGQQVAFSNLGLFTDPGYLDTHTATVDWGDGTGVQAATVAEANGSGKITGAHVYGDNGLLDANGDYVRTIKVTVTDDDGASTSKEFTILVNNVAPTLTVPGDKIANQGAALSIPQLGSFTDPGFLDTHTATVQWGDGSATQALSVMQGAGFGSISGSHTFTAPGFYTATVTVTDDDGGSAMQSFSITVLANSVPFTPILPPNPFGNASPLPPGPAGLTGGGRSQQSITSVYQAIDTRNDLSSGNNRLEEAASAESSAAIEKRFILVIVYADGTESEPVTLPDADVSNLPGLWRRLPDNFYRVYQVQENGTLRLVTQGYVQGGLLVDPNDKNETQDRPPTSQREVDSAAPVLVQAFQDPQTRVSPVDETWAEAGNELQWPTESLVAIATNSVEFATVTPNDNREIAIREQTTLPPEGDILPKGIISANETELPIEKQSPVSTTAALAPLVAAGVAIATSSQPDAWAAEVDRAMEKLPTTWSRTKALWHTRKPR
jgi:hypothetical protein